MTPETEQKFKKQLKKIRETQFMILVILLGIVVLLAILPTL